MNFFIYMFYRLRNYYDYKGSKKGRLYAFSAIGIIISFNILALIFLTYKIFGNSKINSPYAENIIIQKLYFYPIVIILVLLILYVYHRIRKDYIIHKLKSYKTESLRQRKRNGFFVFLYIILSTILMFIAI